MRTTFSLSLDRCLLDASLFSAALAMDIPFAGFGTLTALIQASRVSTGITRTQDLGRAYLLTLPLQYS